MRDDLKAAFRSFKSAPTFTAVALLAITVRGTKIDNDEGISIRRVTPAYHEAL